MFTYQIVKVKLARQGCRDAAAMIYSAHHSGECRVVHILAIAQVGPTLYDDMAPHIGNRARRQAGISA